jgi:hypothetical protein
MEKGQFRDDIRIFGFLGGEGERKEGGEGYKTSKI